MWVAAKLAKSVNTSRPLKIVMDLLTLGAHLELRRWTSKPLNVNKLRNGIHQAVVAGNTHSAEKMAKATAAVMARLLSGKE